MMEKKKIKVVKKIWDFLKKSTYKVNIIYGGAGSGKSYTMAQFLLLKRLFRYKNKRLLITRKTNPSLKQSAMRLVKELLVEYGVEYEENKSEQLIKFKNGSEILFRGLDDPEKIKSQEFNYIWMEEATEFTKDDYLQLRLRLRRYNAGQRNQIFLTFNPIGRGNWVYKEFFEEEKYDVGILQTNYLDNPFLEKEYIEMLKELKEKDEAYYKIYTLGEFADIEHLIYNNYVVISEDKIKNVSWDEIIYGLDFGYNNPSALVEIRIKDSEFYLIEKLYRTHLTNADLIEQLKMLNINGPIYADSAEPDRIKEIEKAGFNIYPSNKNVKDGIDFVKRHKLYITDNSTNLIKEIRSYKWKQDRRGNILDEPVKFMDHLLDAVRYAIYTHYSKPQVGIDIIKF